MVRARRWGRQEAGAVAPVPIAAAAAAAAAEVSCQQEAADATAVSTASASAASTPSHSQPAQQKASRDPRPVRAAVASAAAAAAAPIPARSAAPQQQQRGDFRPSARSSGQRPTKGKDLRVPIMSTEEVARITVPFDQAEESLRAVLGRHGAAIITGIAGAEERANLENAFAQDVGQLLDVEAASRAGLGRVCETVTSDVRQWPLASMEGLGKIERCQLRGLPHGRFAWESRMHPRVRRVYEIIHGSTELVSSCDNSFFAPAEHRQEEQNKSWPHVDHNMHDTSIYDEDGLPVSQWEVFQGLLYVWGSEHRHASTTVLWCGSHRDVYADLMADANIQGRGRRGIHFSRLEDMSGGEARQRLTDRWLCEARRVPVSPGSLLVWDSRTVHQGWRGGPRLVQPVCWEPVKRRDEAARERKLKLAAMGLPSTHWGSLGIPHNLVKCTLPSATKASREGGVQLPLKPTLQPVTLAPGVSVLEMWRQLQEHNWMKPLPKDMKAVLEASIDPKYLKVL